MGFFQTKFEKKRHQWFFSNSCITRYMKNLENGKKKSFLRGVTQFWGLIITEALGPLNTSADSCKSLLYYYNFPLL